ncbi:DNA-directed RNA polymerase II subunit RPB9 [Echinococcus granulosus]|uniref:DNA-directed RNA polymerase II subunit RPB9 n=1 Tax=Echinococcus granulosus TaxID=6210 RepID=W6U543_ECHGR|nr:DNA-directed RNA polymerase II subunit RPB9 [Echinococcus granulosus]EUB55681.1 DNA-directed RNA polymerase II subunit RPB9 [Echinococcus granulosus]
MCLKLHASSCSRFPNQVFGRMEEDVKTEGVGILFCSECNNMLYPKEDKRHKRLMYACRNCEFMQPADNPCIYVNRLEQAIDELALIVPDVVHDPTLPRTEEHQCPKCKKQEAVFFQSQTVRAEENMRLYYVCTNLDCLHKWTE